MSQPSLLPSTLPQLLPQVSPMVLAAGGPTLAMRRIR